MNFAVNLPMRAFNLIDRGCPGCGAQKGGRQGLHYHAESVWCLRCGWAANWQAILGRITAEGVLLNPQGRRT